MNKLYKIQKTRYLKPPSEYGDDSLYPDFQNKLEFFKEDLLSNLYNKVPTSYYKFGDGDYYFLNQIPKGSAKPGKRALKKSYSNIDMNPFIDGYRRNSMHACLITSDNTSKFNKMFNKPLDIPSEVIYGLLANKWLLNNINHKIGIIGARPKVKIIKKLMKYEEYKNYLEVDKFNDFITIDQNFACDNLEKTKKKLYRQVEKSDSELFLVGVGHVKSGLLHELTKIRPAVYLDIGIGVDALAGLVNIYRPYFGNWKNYQINNQNMMYKNVDLLINNFGTLGNTIKL